MLHPCETSYFDDKRYATSVAHSRRLSVQILGSTLKTGIECIKLENDADHLSRFKFGVCNLMSKMRPILILFSIKYRFHLPKPGNKGLTPYSLTRSLGKCPNIWSTLELCKRNSRKCLVSVPLEFPILIGLELRFKNLPLLNQPALLLDDSI